MSSNNDKNNLSQRPRMFSMKSRHSVRSSKSFGSGHKLGLHETHEEKLKQTIRSKADPRLAMTEAQPSAVAAGESNMQSIRAMQHNDKNGNPIAEPDRSNPTRSRWERPLDTIRAFEAAVDNKYQPKSFGRTHSGDALSQLNSRRSSYHQGRNYYDGGGGYGVRVQAPRPESYADNYYKGQGPSPRPRTNQRMSADPAMSGYDGMYPAHGNQQSYDTVTYGSGSGSHATDAWGNSTDPSSDNSSMERGYSTNPKPDLGEQYGLTGFGGAPQYPIQGVGEYDAGQDGPVGRPMYGQSPLRPSNGRYYEQGENGPLPSLPPPPPPPHKDVQQAPRVPIKLGGSSSSAPPASSASYRPEENGASDKRRSWFRKGFGKGR